MYLVSVPTRMVSELANKKHTFKLQSVLQNYLRIQPLPGLVVGGNRSPLSMLAL